MEFNVTTSDAIECIKNLKKIRHDGMQFDACLSKAISDLEEFEEYKKKYGWIFDYSNVVAESTKELVERWMTEKLIKDENELLYRCLYSYGITKENLLNNIDRIELREVAEFGIDSVKRFYIDGEYAFTIKRVPTTITNKPTEGSLCYKVEKIIEDLEEA